MGDLSKIQTGDKLKEKSIKCLSEVRGYYKPSEQLECVLAQTLQVTGTVLNARRTNMF